jgi:hypothetical protein
MSPDSRVVVLAGRRIDAHDAMVRRFPMDCLADVASRIREEFQLLHSRTLICSAANGADLTALHVARELGMQRRVVLPFAIDRFRATSVVDRPGGELWGWLFDELIEEASNAGNLTILEGIFANDTAAFAATNARIVTDAIEFADAAGAPLAGVAVWEGASRGEDDMTTAFVDRMHSHGLPVRIVSPDGQ